MTHPNVSAGNCFEPPKLNVEGRASTCSLELIKVIP